MSDNQPARVGDIVRLSVTTTHEGAVRRNSKGALHVDGYFFEGPNRTVEVLTRAEAILPTADGFYLGYDSMMEADFLVIVSGGRVCLPDATKPRGIGHIVGDAKRFAPFARLDTFEHAIGAEDS